MQVRKYIRARIDNYLIYTRLVSIMFSIIVFNYYACLIIVTLNITIENPLVDILGKITRVHETVKLQKYPPER